MNKKVKVCPKCESRNVKATGHIVTTVAILPGKYECMDCGYVGFPLELDSGKDTERFRGDEQRKMN